MQTLQEVAEAPSSFEDLDVRLWTLRTWTTVLQESQKKFLILSLLANF